MKAASKKSEGNKLVAVIGDEVIDIFIEGYCHWIFIDWYWIKECQR